MPLLPRELSSILGLVAYVRKLQFGGQGKEINEEVGMGKGERKMKCMACMGEIP